MNNAGVSLRDVYKRQEICRGDADSGFAVATVRKNLLNDSTREGIVVSDLTDTKKLGQSDIVIAIGSPAGDSDAVVYGMITVSYTHLDVYKRQGRDIAFNCFVRCNIVRFCIECGT